MASNLKNSQTSKSAPSSSFSSKPYDLIVIGSGPGGEVGAIRAAQLGLKTALVEKQPYLGGTCLNVGCIPTKALLESAKMYDKISHASEWGIEVGKPVFDWHKIMDRKDKIVGQQRKGLQFLMKKNKIDVHQGHGRLMGPPQNGLFKVEVAKTAIGEDGKKEVIEARHVLLATGSRVRELPFARSTGRGILTSDSILFIDHVPETLAVIGGGVVGMEFASLFGRMGSQVTVYEGGPTVLPSEDEQSVKELSRHLTRKQNIKIIVDAGIEALQEKGGKVHLKGKVSKKGASAEPHEATFDKVLVSIGREPVTDDVGLSGVSFRTQSGHIKVNEHYQVTDPSWKGLYAIGDIIETPALAHTASAEATHAVEKVAGHSPHLIDYQTNPNAIYTYPEVASLGKTEQQLKKEGQDYKVAEFPFAPMAKAKIEATTEGFVKLLYEPKYKEILGAHIVHAKATDLIGELVLGKVLETTVDEIAHAIHPHPTISETIMEAAHVAMGGAIHL